MSRSDVKILKAFIKEYEEDCMLSDEQLLTSTLEVVLDDLNVLRRAAKAVLEHPEPVLQLRGSGKADCVVDLEEALNRFM